MKITIGSPDGLGDFVLRMPLVEALLGAGHELQLVMRPPAADLARDLFPEIEVLVPEKDPFRAETKKQRHPFRSELAEIRRFTPDLYVASTFQLNFFDQIFLQEVRDVRSAGFTTDDDFWPSDTSVDPRELAARFAIRVPVPTEMPEGEKGRLLAQALTGTAPERRAPRPPTQEASAEARRILEAHELRERGFVAVCAGSRPGLTIKDWGEANWAALLGEIGGDEKRAFVFLGNPKESASVARLMESLPPGARHVNLAENPPPMGVSYALISMASAYLGRDSGLMHLAALADIPLLAVFAGGHWPRFLPEARRGAVLTREAPCRGCNFYCPFPEPWCVKTVPVGEAATAWRRLTRAQSLEVAELGADEHWLALAAELDAPAYARERSLAARAEIAELENERLWMKLVNRLIA